MKQETVLSRQEENEGSSSLLLGVALQQILDRISKTQGPDRVTQISEEDLVRLIDLGQALDEKAKQYGDLVAQIKGHLLRQAQLNGWKEKSGLKAWAKISSQTSRSIFPLALVKRIKELGKQTLFETLFQVRLTEAFKYLGEAALADITKTETKEYGSVSLKRK